MLVFTDLVYPAGLLALSNGINMYYLGGRIKKWERTVGDQMTDLENSLGDKMTSLENTVEKALLKANKNVSIVVECQRKTDVHDLSCGRKFFAVFEDKKKKKENN